MVVLTDSGHRFNIADMHALDPEIFRDKTPRSPAQAEASRKNGAKSRGPRTAKGKARSRGNAVRHGILARKVVPAADGRHEHDEYRLLLKGLADEYDPRTATEWAWVETLAHDFVQLGRIKQLQEAVMMVDSMPDGSFNAAFTLDIEEGLAVLDRANARLAKGRPPSCTADEAARLAKTVAERLDQMRKQAHHTRATLAAGEEVHDVWVEQAELLDRITPDGLFRDEAHLRAILAGSASVTGGGGPNGGSSRDPGRSGVGERWALLLEHVRALEAKRLTNVGGYQAAFDAAYRGRQAKLLERLPSMEVLQRYESHFRKTIERTTKLLEARLEARRRVEA